MCPHSCSATDIRMKAPNSATPMIHIIIWW
jgi:hypothetical protein